jgi:D-alanyl-D-alanine carboxypeptidase
MAISNVVQARRRDQTQRIERFGRRSLIVAALAVAAAVAIPLTIAAVGMAVRIGPPAPAGLPTCRVADRPVRADGYDQWASTLLDPAHTLGPTYAPPDLRRVLIHGQEVTVREFVIQPLSELLDAAAADGVNIRVTSSYRSYADQLALIASNPEEDDLIAQPGHSEHQLGTTVDLADADDWLAGNAARFGFVMSFPADRSPAWTCYRSEPWHYRYFGPNLAAEITTSGLSPREWLWLHQ